MDSKELRNLHEAYLDVYAPQENIEEGLRSAVKRLLGGGKKEAEAPKPESRGDQLRKKYNVGPEKSDTSAKRQILDRSRAKAEKDEKDYGDKPFQKQVAQKSKAAHDRYLKAGYSKYGAGDARGRGNKAAKRAASLNREEFEYIVNALVEEGYDLSSYTWDEMYEVCLDEAVKGASRHDTEMRKAASTERKSGIKNRLSPAAGKDNADKMQRDVKFFDKLTKKNRNVVGLDTKEEVEQIDELSVGKMLAYTKTAEKNRSDLNKKWDKGTASYREKMRVLGREEGEERASKNIKKKTGKRPYEMNALDKARYAVTKESYDLFDTILEYLVAEGYADTNESALVIMANMSEEWREDILGEGKLPLDQQRRSKIGNQIGKRLQSSGSEIIGSGSAFMPKGIRNNLRQSAAKKVGEVKKMMGALKSAQKEEYMDEAQEARNNPEKYEREQSKKYAPVRGERTPMPPRGNKRREDFEKWYAANVR
jgi:hypothetical protein